MTFNETLEKTRELAKTVKSPGNDYFIAVQINLTGENGGVFYIEFLNGKINIEPYEYIDKNCAINISPEDFIKLITQKLDPVAAFTTKKLTVDGDVGKALEFSNVLKNNTVK
ncbi:MAG: SCP2 sterol-binding domain-containing protein [Oscillospiraceae bacterium]